GRPRVGGDGYPILNADLSQTQDVTEAARAVMRRLESLIAETEAPMKTTMRNIEAFTGTLARNSDRFERILAGVEKLSGGPDQQGEIAEAIAAVKALTESGGRDWHALTVDGRRAMGTIEQVFRNLDRNPQRLLFGNSSSSGPRR
ncbi:MAG: hypothetical protein HY056_01175, partial [Proteobacteria bacterium]|nr:hypothetical protein [Pseudomonadota bacterium]